MAASKTVGHTPGPWEIGAATETQHDYPKRYLGWTVTIWGPNRKDGGICNVSNRRPSLGTPHPDSVDEARANARLIAAAPELLAALKASVAGIESVDELVDLTALGDFGTVESDKRRHELAGALMLMAAEIHTLISTIEGGE